jgi:microcin C transport system substrate-binding protein
LEGRRLLIEAGWTVRPADMKLVHDDYRDGKGNHLPFAFEILLVNPSFERIALPYARTLKRLGITASVRTVDTAQFQNRINEFDYDMVVMLWGQSLSPGNEQLNYWGSAAADAPGSFNLARIANPAVDEMIDRVIRASDRRQLVLACNVLDRLLQWGHYVVPQWYYNKDRVAYWDKFGRPAVIPMNGGANVMSWWIDPRRAETLASRRAALNR